jgi:hypothetical protein
MRFWVGANLQHSLAKAQFVQRGSFFGKKSLKV